MDKRTTKLSKLTNLWMTMSNPLRYLTRGELTNLLENARHGNDARLQVAFHEMERVMPIFGVVMQRRLSGIQNKQWKISPNDENNAESVEQAERVSTIFHEADAKNIDGLSEAIRHLTLASFRGRAAVKPFIVENAENSEGIELIFKNLENWNVLEWNNHLYYIPNADVGFCPALGGPPPDGVEEIQPKEVAWVKEDRPIDIPGIEIYLRQLVGEESWARATERYGVAPVVITAPEGTTDSALPVWSERAMRLVEGGSGVLPPGADVHILTEARGQDPFSKYVEHQVEQIVLLACGSTLGTLAGPTGLGSGLADVQENTFNSLVSYDAKRISNALTDVAVRKVARRLGYGKLLCRFDFIDTDRTKPVEYLEMAKKAKELGFSVNIDELKRLVPSLTFVEKGEELPDFNSPYGVTAFGGKLKTPRDSANVHETEWSPQD